MNQIQKIDNISIKIPIELLNSIPENILSHIITQTQEHISRTIILTFTNQSDRDELYELLSHI